MPFFESTPTVFPPLIPSCGPLGNVPRFAFAVEDCVVAWTPPDEFPWRADNLHLNFRRRRPLNCESHWLHLESVRTWSGDSDKESAREALERRLLARYNHLRSVLKAVSNNAENDEIFTIDVDEQTQPRPNEFQWRYLGQGVRLGKARRVLWQSVAVIVRDTGDAALGFQLREEITPEPETLSNDVLRGYVEWFTERVAWAASARVHYWTHDVGFATSAEWAPVRSVDIAEGTLYGPPEINTVGSNRGWRAEVSVRPPELRAEIDLRKRAEYALISHRDHETEVREVPVPAHGHVIMGAVEVRVHPLLKTRPADAEIDPDFPDEWDPIPGTLVRIAYVAVGREHVVCVCLSVGDGRAEHFEAWWKVALERLHVTQPSTPGAEAR